MIIVFLFLLLVFVGGLIAILLLRPDTGYVLINYGPWVAETSLAVLVFGIALFFLITWLLLRLSGLVVRLPGSLREAVDRRRADRARDAFENGLLALFEGNWARAESELIKRASDHHAPHLNYLAAARAAQRQAATDRRDHYLRLAMLNRPEHEFATLLSQADLQRKRGEFQTTRQTALKLREKDPMHPFAIELLAESHAALGEWGALRTLLLEPASANAIPAGRRDQLMGRAIEELMQQAIDDARLPILKALWEGAGSLRDKPELRRAYARGLARLNADSEALALIAQALAADWDGELALLYGDLHAGDPITQLATVESWLALYGEKTELLQVAGHVCLANRLWGKARSYLEAVIAIAPTPKAYLDLARLCADTQQPDEAARHYRLGLELAAGHP
ncbi:MAG: heme biosynthesis HemY N-terminal domain-containing protein [Nevskia sp.]|nr:heme biosynthesis HemY N-terminal domain-containing protein [Nevskia sp.]